MRVGRVVTMAVGAGAAAATAYLLSRRDGDAAAEAETGQRRIERDVRQRLEENVGADSLSVSALSPSIVELRGSVRTRDEAHDLVERAQDVEGVRTIVNRLDIQEEDRHARDTRSRYADGSPELTERHWYGQRVGTGRRRQAPGTDPDRPSDKVPMLSRELDEGRLDEPDLEPYNADSRVIHESKPGVERAIEDAGLRRESPEARPE